eukprot:3065782-Prymnesium_polylepis.1
MGNRHRISIARREEEAGLLVDHRACLHRWGGGARQAWSALHDWRIDRAPRTEGSLDACRQLKHHRDLEHDVEAGGHCEPQLRLVVFGAFQEAGRQRRDGHEGCRHVGCGRIRAVECVQAEPCRHARVFDGPCRVPLSRATHRQGEFAKVGIRLVHGKDNLADLERLDAHLLCDTRRRTADHKRGEHRRIPFRGPGLL